MSEIDFGKLRSLAARDLERALERDGFQPARQQGSHRRFVHPDGRRVTVPRTRPGDTFAPGTLRSIIELQAKSTHFMGTLQSERNAEWSDFASKETVWLQSRAPTILLGTHQLYPAVTGTEVTGWPLRRVHRRSTRCWTHPQGQGAGGDEVKRGFW